MFHQILQEQMELQVPFQLDILQVVAEDQILPLDHLLEQEEMAELVVEEMVVDVELQMDLQQQLILVVEVEEPQIIVEVQDLADQELLLLNTNFKINMYLLNLKINI